MTCRTDSQESFGMRQAGGAMGGGVVSARTKEELRRRGGAARRRVLNRRAMRVQGGRVRRCASGSVRARMVDVSAWRCYVKGALLSPPRERVHFWGILQI